MKPNLNNMNHENPPTASASDPRDNPCLGSDPTIAALAVMADDGITYLLPYAQFLFAEHISNPVLEKAPDAPPESMRIHFVRAKVVVVGSGLKTAERMIQKFELKFVKSADRRLAATLNTHVAAVTFTLTEENL